MKTFTPQKLRKLTLASVLALAAGWGSQVQAATGTNNLAVSATVVANCTISTTPLAFGSYDPVVANATTALDGTGAVTVTCTTGSTAAITLGQGASPVPTTSTDAAPLRRLLNGTANFLTYSLFIDSARTLVWGNDATVDVATTGTGAADAHTVYGRVTAGQNQPAGAYADTVVATVTF